MLNSVGLPGPGVDAWIERRPSRARSAAARASSRRSGVAASTSTQRPPRPLKAVAHRSDRGRGQPLVSRTSKRAATCSRTRPTRRTRATLGGRRRARRLGSDVRQAVAERHRHRRDRRRRARRGRDRPHAGELGDGSADRRRRAHAALGCGRRRVHRARRSSRSRCARCGRCRARIPVVPIIGTGGVTSGDRRGRDDARGRARGRRRHRDLCRSARDAADRRRDANVVRGERRRATSRT